MRRPDLEKFGKEHGLNSITIADLAEYKKRPRSLQIRGRAVVQAETHHLPRSFVEE